VAGSVLAHTGGVARATLAEARASAQFELMRERALDEREEYLFNLIGI
jgi:hypothetical protein